MTASGILAAARTQEVVGARWSEIDLKNATWTVPAGRMKGGVEHKVMLAPEVIERQKKRVANWQLLCEKYRPSARAAE